MTAPKNNPSPRAKGYAAAVLAQAPRLLGMLDREPHSPSYGSFDREHWAWKFRDFPLGMQQSAVYPAALLWRYPFPGSPCHGHPRLLEWICAAFAQTLDRQRDNGAWDAFAPNEQDAGPTLGILHGLAEAHRLLQENLPADLRQRFRRAFRRGCEFALRFRETETHAFVSNHWALFAVTYLNAAELLAEERFRRAAKAVIERILLCQSRDGWYEEYGGPDPGYESLGILHLAVYWQRTGRADLLASLRRAVAFYSHCVHPDGSVGGVYGSRHTSLYYPGGFEMLASEIPEAAAIAAYMAERMDRGNVVTPVSADAENLPSMIYANLEAALASREHPAAPPLPCETLEGVRTFAYSGITVAGTERYYAVMNSKKGGVCRVFDKRSGKIAYEDAGYVVRAGRGTWISQRLGMGQSIATEDPEVTVCEAAFAEYRPLLPTPGRFLILRLLNLTLFRSATLGRWLRTRIVALLMGSSHPGPLRLRRTFRFLSDRVEMADCVWRSQPLQVNTVTLPRALTGIHMGSAKYFHPSELMPVPEPPVSAMAAELNRTGKARCEFTLQFLPEGGATLMAGDSTSAEPASEQVART